MTIKMIIVLVTMVYLKTTPCFASKKDPHHDIASDNAATLVANFMHKHHDEIKRKVIASHPFGEDIDYAQLSSGQREQLEQFIDSQLVMEAQDALPLSMGEVLAAFMYVEHLEDLDENPYKKSYRDCGISNAQIEEASQLIHDNFHRLRTNIQENANVSRIAKKHQVNFLIHALGEEIINLLQTNMKVDLAAAIEIYTYLQQLEKIYALQEKERIDRDRSEGASSSSASSSSTKTKESSGLLLARSFSKKDIPPSHLEKHWQTYAYITGGLGIAALIGFLKTEGD